MRREDAAYQALYCEENIWRLVQTPWWTGRAHVAIVSNEGGRVALWKQRAGAAEDDGLVVWDYHVILIEEGPTPRVWDLDSTQAFGCDAEDYLRATFRRVPPVFEPRFRLIEAPVYATGLGSDRSHMRDEGGAYRSPPPPWPRPQGTTLALHRLLDPGDPLHSDWIDLGALRGRLRGA